MKITFSPLLALAPLLAALGGCEAKVGHGPERSPVGDVLIDNGFETDAPPSWGSGGSSGAGGSGSDSTSSHASEEEAARVIEEADIVKVDGDRLYALSPISGLAVVDLRDPDHLRLVGRRLIEGTPVEMYVRDGQAHVLVNAWSHTVTDAAGQQRWEATSQIVTLDLKDDQALPVTSRQDVPGSIADSRIVGDVLYLVTYESDCWGCAALPTTRITSFSVKSRIAKVDALAFSAPDKTYSFWQRSVLATSERMYVAGRTWTPSEEGAAESIIQVVDIHDPGGKLTRGADVPIGGPITSRWQMDEFHGVLRVVSQRSTGAPRGNPKLETFTVASAAAVTPLGSTDIVLPKPESLQSVRFDGVRGYAVTSERTDPLFTLDLTDPKNPRQVGQLEMPGFMFHMELRGDRLIGFGYDDTGPKRHLAVSLFDVGAVASPRMLSRVAFGVVGASIAEDSARLHKALRLFDVQGLIAVPFTSWYSTGSCAEASGLQLVDWSHDALQLRGLAVQYGTPRRALLVKDRLIGVSNRTVATFDIGSRATPVLRSELAVSRAAIGAVVEVGNHVAVLTTDERAGSAALVLSPRAGASDVNVVGTALLSAAGTGRSETCYDPNAPSWWNARLFVNGSYVYVTVPRPIPSTDGSRNEYELVALAVDVADPTNPKVVGTTRFGGGAALGWWSYDGRYIPTIGVTPVGHDLVQLGPKLAYLETSYPSYESGEPYEPTRVLHVADFSEPAAPQTLPPVALGRSLGALPLQASGGVVRTTRWLPSEKTPGKVRFFVDRIDLRGPTPVTLPSINVPGSLATFDEVSQRLVTFDYHAVEIPAGAPECEQFPPSEPAPCRGYDRELVVSDVADRLVTRRQVLPLSRSLTTVLVSDNRLYIERREQRRYDYDVATSTSRTTLTQPGAVWAFGGIREGDVGVVASWTGDVELTAANGTLVALTSDHSSVAVYDTSASAPKTVLRGDAMEKGYDTQLLLSGDRAFSSGDRGFGVLPYSTP